jgi:hypothetical protein
MEAVSLIALVGLRSQFDFNLALYFACPLWICILSTYSGLLRALVHTWNNLCLLLVQKKSYSEMFFYFKDQKFLYFLGVCVRTKFLAQNK